MSKGISASTLWNLPFRSCISLNFVLAKLHSVLLSFQCIQCARMSERIHWSGFSAPGVSVLQIYFRVFLLCIKLTLACTTKHVPFELLLTSSPALVFRGSACYSQPHMCQCLWRNEWLLPVSLLVVEAGRNELRRRWRGEGRRGGDGKDDGVGRSRAQWMRCSWWQGWLVDG
jgi:hypothetical protein